MNSSIQAPAKADRCQTTLWSRFKNTLSSMMEIKRRVWVVNVYSSTLQNETFVVCEDNFGEPLQWMKRKHYTDSMLMKVDNMKLSQVMIFKHKNVNHRLIRVK